MRVTNQMMTNSMLNHINQNKINLSKLEEQYSTGKKIQKPSDDPIVAVRALKLRTSLTEVTQYLENNIPDAESWMEVTESALDNVNSILKQMNTYCVQGATDGLTSENRTSILTNLTQLKEQIYQEGNSQYAGRYVFTGYKTDTPLIYTCATSYSNTEAKLSLTKADGTEDGDGNYTFELNSQEENMEAISSITIAGTSYTVKNMTSGNFKDTTVDADSVYYIEDTNQLVLGSNVAATLGDDTEITVTGEKFQGYRITETFTGKDIGTYSTVVIPGENTDENGNGTGTYGTPSLVQVNRLQLSYDNIYTKTTVDKNGDEVLTSSLKSLSYTDSNGNEGEFVVTKTLYSTDEGAYEPGDDEVYVIADTGEIVMGANVASTLKDATNISVNYDRTEFAASELKPEHFFDCTFVSSDGSTVDYTLKDQAITYEVNFGQTLQVNTEAKECITHDIDRLVDDITTAVNNVVALEEQIADIEDQLEDTSLSDEEISKLEAQKEQLETALSLSESVMQSAFESAITTTEDFQDDVNVAVADLGARSARLTLTKSRLEDQQVELEDLKSTNEDVDLVEIVIRYKSAEATYTSSLTAAASVVKTNLLNFL